MQFAQKRSASAKKMLMIFFFNLESRKCTRMRFHCANCLVVLCNCATWRERWPELVCVFSWRALVLKQRLCRHSHRSSSPPDHPDRRVTFEPRRPELCDVGRRSADLHHGERLGPGPHHCPGRWKRKRKFVDAR